MNPSASRLVVRRSSRLHQCSTKVSLERSFTSSCTRYQIPPESPSFVEVPQPPQQRAPYSPRPRGVLPVPRNIFPPTEEHKATPEYLEAVTRPKKEVRSAATATPLTQWKDKMAEMRKTNLREGITELYQRKQVTEGRLKARSTRRQEERQKLVDEPEREDERLTNPSIVQQMQHSKIKANAAGSAGLSGSELVLSKGQKKILNRRKVAQQDAIHKLYMNAQSFIVTEQQLNSAVEEAFGTQENPVTFNRYGTSVWDLGNPETVEDRLNKANKTAGSSETSTSSTELTQQRIKRIAEVLTGGKIPS